MHRLALFASGSGSNAQRIIEYFKGHPTISVEILLSNNPRAFALERAEKLGIPTSSFTRDEFYQTSKVMDLLSHYKVDFLVLAGFLWLVPPGLLEAYPGRIVNIHPALLPLYGGKGMYGHHVHQAVIDHGDRESGISIHFVNAKYDSGDIIFQARCPVMPGDTPDTLAGRIHILEHTHYPRVIEEVVSSLKG